MEVSGRRKKKDGDDHTSGILCDPCLGVNEEENAVFYCTECNEFLCDADAKAHRKAAISKSHQLLDRNSMPIKKIGTHEYNLCSIHKGIELIYFCNSHDKSCCSVCTSTEHKQCKIEYIDDIATGYEKSSEYKSLVKDMAYITRLLQSAKQKIVEFKRNKQRLHSEIVSEIRKFRLEINSILDSLETSTLEEAKSALYVDTDAAESTATHCDTLMALLQEKASVDKLRKIKQKERLVMHSKIARERIKGIEDNLLKLPNLNKRRDYKFIPDKKIPELLESLRGLGSLDIRKESTKRKENDQEANKDHGAEALVPVVNQPVTASHVRDINIEHSTDKYCCCITGGVMLDQIKLVLVDGDNCSVKLVDVTSNNVTSCIKLPTTPQGITRVDQDQVVVSCGEGKLMFLRVSETLSIVEEMDIGGNLEGIAYTNNSLLVVFGYPDLCVKEMDLRGNTLKSFKTHAAGNNLFIYPEYIALSKDLNTIFVSDSGNGCVTSLRMDGRVQGVYTDNNLRYPCGLAVDGYDNVYVAGCKSHNLCQLSTEFKPIRVLLDIADGIKYPRMVTYCKTEHKLYIGYDSGPNGNHVSVFQLQ